MDFAVERIRERGCAAAALRQQFALKALRVETLRMLLGNPAFRQFSRMVASSDLLADFCGVAADRWHPGSLQERAGACLEVFHAPTRRDGCSRCLSRWRRSTEPGGASWGLAAAVATDVCLVDTTCLEANIHFPVDWVLLRDVAGTCSRPPS